MHIRGRSMPKFVIEREVPGAGSLTDAELRELSQKSVSVLKGMGPEIQWLTTYSTAPKRSAVSPLRTKPPSGNPPSAQASRPIASPRCADLSTRQPRSKPAESSSVIRMFFAALTSRRRRLWHQHFLNSFLEWHSPTF